METINKRLQELKHEYQQGQRRLILLQQQEKEVNETLLRIQGAVQVLEELSEKLSKSHSESTPQNLKEMLAAV